MRRSDRPVLLTRLFGKCGTLRTLISRRTAWGPPRETWDLEGEESGNFVMGRKHFHF